MQELFEGLASRVRIAQVFIIDLSDGEERLKAILTARIFAPQELVFSNGGVEVFFSRRELAAHLGHGFGNRNHAGVRLTRHRSYVVDLAISVGNVLILFASTLIGGQTVQRLPHLLRFVELIAGLLLADRGAGQGCEADAAQDGNEGYGAHGSQASLS